jgi:hypothetical protein
MSMPRNPQATVGFVDRYCAYYRALFADVRSFEQFTALHRAQLLVRGQGQTKQGIKASVDPGEPEV